MLYNIISFVLIIASALSIRKTKFSFTIFIPYLILGFFVALLNIVYLVADYFSGKGINYAVVFHIRSGLTDAPISENIDIILAALSIFAVVLIYMFGAIRVARRNNVQNIKFVYASFGLVLGALLLSPTVRDVAKLYRFGIFSAENIEVGLKKSSIVDLGGEHKNLLYIYGESLEQTWSDQTVFPGLTPGLNRLQARGLVFTNISQKENDNFTMAAFVASMCGLSLKGSVYQKKNAIAGSGSGTICMPDLLKRVGYFNSYYGASINFAGKKYFLADHSFDEIKDSKALKDLVPADTKFGSWGMYDSSLLDLVYNRFAQLSEQKGKFALYTLTTTTHPPRGEPDPECENIKYENGSNKLLNAVHCADMQVTRFVEKVLDSPYAENTIVVLGSDHFAFGNVARSRLEKVNKRTNRLMIFGKGVKASSSVYVEGFTRDISPTILPFMGYKGTVGTAKDLLVEVLPRVYRK